MFALSQYHVSVTVNVNCQTQFAHILLELQNIISCIQTINVGTRYSVIMSHSSLSAASNGSRSSLNGLYCGKVAVYMKSSSLSVR